MQLDVTTLISEAEITNVLEIRVKTSRSRGDHYRTSDRRLDILQTAAAVRQNHDIHLLSGLEESPDRV